MGVDHYLLASTLRLVIAQRLVRLRCLACDAEGCFDCRYSGYKGRSVIAEIFEVDNKLREMISEKRPLPAYLAYLKEKNFTSLADHGNQKVEWGVTTKLEVLRVLGE